MRARSAKHRTGSPGTPPGGRRGRRVENLGFSDNIAYQKVLLFVYFFDQHCILVGTILIKLAKICSFKHFWKILPTARRRLLLEEFFTGSTEVFVRNSLIFSRFWVIIRCSAVLGEIVNADLCGNSGIFRKIHVYRNIIIYLYKKNLRKFSSEKVGF